MRLIGVHVCVCVTVRWELHNLINNRLPCFCAWTDCLRVMHSFTYCLCWLAGKGVTLPLSATLTAQLTTHTTPPQHKATEFPAARQRGAREGLWRHDVWMDGWMCSFVMVCPAVG